MPNYSSRNFEERGFTVGIGGYDCSYQRCGVCVSVSDNIGRPVGSGKTALTLALCLSSERLRGMTSFTGLSLWEV